MSATGLLADARALGVAFTVEGAQLRVIAPRGAMTPPMLEALRQNKAALIALLRDPVPAENEAPDAGQAAPNVADCCACGAPWEHDVYGRRACARCDALGYGFGAKTRPRELASAVQAEVERIEPEARRLGWTHAELWQTHGWLNVRGLAAFVRPGGRILSVSAEHAVIESRTGRRMTYRREPSPAPTPDAHRTGGL